MSSMNRNRTPVRPIKRVTYGIRRGSDRSARDGKKGPLACENACAPDRIRTCGVCWRAGKQFAEFLRLRSQPAGNPQQNFRQGCDARITASRNDSVNAYAHSHAMGTGRRVAVAGVVAVVVALAPSGVASADNSNSNTNDNDVTDIGNPSNMSARSGVSTGWPPADLSWPPTDIGNSGSESAEPIVPVSTP